MLKEEKLAEIELYSKKAGNYSEGDFNQDVIFLKKNLHEFTQIFKPSNTLDIGCGTGRYFESCTTSCLVGVDISLPMLKKIKSKTNLSLSDAFHLPFKNNSFDFVYSIGVLGLHVPLNTKIVEEVHRVLKPNGSFLFTATSLKSRLLVVLIKKTFVILLPKLAVFKNLRLRFITSKYANTKSSIYTILKNRFEIISLNQVTPTFPQYLIVANVINKSDHTIHR